MKNMNIRNRETGDSADIGINRNETMKLVPTSTGDESVRSMVGKSTEKQKRRKVRASWGRAFGEILK